MDTSPTTDETSGSPTIMSRRALAILMVTLAVGAAGTWMIGQAVKSKSTAGWVRQAESDTAVATEAAQAWLAQAETIIKGLAVAFQRPNRLSEVEFNDLVAEAGEWNSEFSLDSVATVRRISRGQRAEYEVLLGGPILSAGAVSETAPDSFEHFVVDYASSRGGLLEHRRDLLTDKAAGDLIKTAYALSGQAFMGPVRKAPDGRLLALIAQRIRNSAGADVIAAEVDISALINHLMANELPEGIRLRLSERETETAETTAVRPVFGALSPAADVLHTVTYRLTKGVARWTYNWDILTSYQGGPPNAMAVTFQVGGLLFAIFAMTVAGFLIHQNVTIRKKVREQTVELRQVAEEANMANRAKTEFLANMSHELRTPLNAVIGYSEMLRLEMFGPLGDARYQEYASDINSSGTHLLELIGDILDVSKIEAEKLDLTDEALDLTAVVAACIRIVNERAELHGVTLNVSNAGGLPRLRADEVRLKQIILNLLSNAIKFTPSGGAVTIRADCPDGALRIVAEDTGIGISAGEIPKLMEPFRQLDNDHLRAEPGAGLGLYLCNNLTKLHGGTLRIESTVGTGTQVFIDFPAERTVT